MRKTFIMLLSKIRRLTRNNEENEKVLYLEKKINNLEKNFYDLEKRFDSLRKENKELSESVQMLKENNEYTLSDIYTLAQNLAAIYSIISEHNKIIEVNGLDKKIIYH